MTTKNMEARRDEFERWYDNQAFTSRLDVVSAWAGFNAALDSICVELPQCDPSEAVQYGTALDDFKKALTAAGVPYK